MATLVATEEFPKPTVSPKATTPVVIMSNKLESGVQTVTRDCTSSVSQTKLSNSVSALVDRSLSPYTSLVQVVSLKFAVAGGSSTEAHSAKGAAQFLSTAAFAGNNSSSGVKIVHHLEGLGASFQSYADKEKVRASFARGELIALSGVLFK